MSFGNVLLKLGEDVPYHFLHVLQETGVVCTAVGQNLA